MSKSDQAEQPKNFTASILKWIGIATAIVSLILGVNQLNNIWQARQKAKATELKIASLIKDAHTQRDADDFETGWKTLEQAHLLNPESPLVHNEKVNFAMQWLRDLLFINRTDKYATIISRLLPVLYRASNETSGQQAADILAHIGWANFLQRFEVDNHLKISELFEQAVKKDTFNSYAHVMWGFWLMKDQKGEKNLNAAAEHFNNALKGKRDTAFIRLLQLWAFQQYDYPGSKIQLFIAINDMRINNEKIPEEMKERIVGRTYDYYSKDLADSIANHLTPGDHLNTFLFLTNQMNLDDHPYRKLVLAKLYYHAGFSNEATKIFSSMQADNNIKMYTWYNEIEAAMKKMRK